MSTHHARGWGDGPGHYRRASSQTIRARTPGEARTHNGLHGWADVGLSPDTLAWHEQAACRHSDPEAFFPELVGIWGGLTTRERHRHHRAAADGGDSSGQEAA